MTAQPADDPQLLARYAAGDDGAFAQLYDRHDRALFDFIRRLVRGSARGATGSDDALAEELHQETWVAVSRACRQFDPAQARFVTWLYTIARHKVIDQQRSAAALRLVPLGDAPPGRDGAADTDDGDPADRWAADSGWSPEQRWSRREAGDALVRAVEALPAAQREVFVLFAVEDLSLAEIASITGTGVETAKSRLRYARTVLREALAHWQEARHG
jgi:RNA polymerase sigma factor (sigma-70 family)